MNIIKKENGNTLNIALEGRLDTVTSPELEAVLKESLDGMTELVLDFEKLDYISSAGLRVLLSNHKTMSKRDGMKITHVNQSIMEIFDVTGFGDILEIE
ncbi:MAG: STAS domain-containing protein [Eubacterium sp.]|nr:STAS domain-containing protein [Eubacterium sp.]